MDYRETHAKKVKCSPKPLNGDLPNTLLTAREYDSESQLYDYRSRKYNPYTGRFNRRDSIGYRGGLNLYSYVQNNPVNKIDPSGLFATPFSLPPDPHGAFTYPDPFKAFISGLKHLFSGKGERRCPTTESNNRFTIGWKICGPDVTEWFFDEVVTHFKWADKERQSLEGFMGFVQRPSAYRFFRIYAASIPHKTMTFREADCPTNCPNTVTLCNTCIERSELGNLIFGISGRAYGLSGTELWTGAKLAGFLKKPEDEAATAIGYDMIADDENWWNHISSSEKMCSYMTTRLKWLTVRSPFLDCRTCTTPLRVDYPHTIPGYPCK